MIAGANLAQHSGVESLEPPTEDVVCRRRPQPQARERRPQFGRGVVQSGGGELLGQRVHPPPGDGVEIAADDDVGRVIGDVGEDGRELPLAQRRRGQRDLDVG